LRWPSSSGANSMSFTTPSVAESVRGIDRF
jgi:hypothetical protein